VLVASVLEADHRHEASHKLLMKFASHEASCAAHTLAEFYASLTGMNPPYRLRPEHAELILNQFKINLVCIALTADEIFQAIHRTVALKLPGGIIYDALILACARKNPGQTNLHVECKAFPDGRARSGRADCDTLSDVRINLQAVLFLLPHRNPQRFHFPVEVAALQPEQFGGAAHVIAGFLDLLEDELALVGVASLLQC